MSVERFQFNLIQRSERWVWKMLRGDVQLLNCRDMMHALREKATMCYTGACRSAGFNIFLDSLLLSHHGERRREKNMYLRIISFLIVMKKTNGIAMRIELE